MAITFEGYERRIDKINKVLAEYGINGLEDAQKICKDKGINVEEIVKGIQPICFENAPWAYTVGAAIAIKKGCKKAAVNRGLFALYVYSYTGPVLAAHYAPCPQPCNCDRTYPPCSGVPDARDGPPPNRL